tara:strand:- start:553 stop:3123 length:2571 start_codon:yes stop_codon:yes gene_type:complete
MRIAEYKQMMAYLMRPKYQRGGYVRLKNGGLLEEYYGKSKLAYQKAVDDGFQGTFEEYLRLISPTKSFADGGFVQKQINEINRLIKNTNLNQSEIAEAVNKKFPKEKPLEGYNVTHYGRKYFNVPARAPLNEKYKKRFTFRERKGKLLTDILEKEDLVESIKKDVANKLTKQQIVDKYRIGGKGEKLLPSGVKQIGKGTLEEIYEELDIVRGRADLRKVDINTPENKKNLKNIKKFFSDPKLSRAEAYDKTGLSRGQVDKLLATYKQQKGEPLIINRRALGVQFEGAGQERDVFKQKTKELQKFQTFLKKYKNKPLRSGTVELAKAIKEFGTNPVGFQQNLSMLRKIYKGQERPGFKIDNELKSIIGKFPISTGLTADVLIEAGYTPKQINKLNQAQAIIRKLDANQGAFLNQLEHKVPKAVASELLNKGQITQAQYRDIIGRITPVTTDLNQWKKQYDLQRLMNVKNYLASNMEADDLKKFNEVENDIIKTAKKISGGYDIGKIEINADGKINLISPDEVFKTKQVQGIGPGSRSLIDYYKNIKYHNILAKKYNTNKSDDAFGTLRAYRAGADVPIFNEKITNEISKLSSSEDFTKYLTKNTDGPLFKGLTKLVSPQMRRNLLGAGKVGGATTLATLIPSMLLAKTPETAGEPGAKEVTSMLPTAVGAGAGAAAIGTKTGRNILKRAGRTIFDKGIRPLGTRAAGSLLAADQVRRNIQSGENVADAVVDPLVGLELSFPGLFKENLAKITTNPTAQRILNLGRFARLTTPVGLGITAAGLAVDVGKAIYKRKQLLDSMTPTQKDVFLAQEYEDLGGIAGEGAAAGGLIGKKSGPPPESGPTPQGLDYLIKRGRRS